MTSKQVRAVLHRDQAFRDRFLEPAARRRPIAINMRLQANQLLSGNDDPGDLLSRSNTLVYLLAMGADDPEAVPDEDYSEFAGIVVQVLADQGVGSEFGRHDLVVESIDAAIARVRKAGHSASRLLLAKAQYLSNAQNESRVRHATLRQAEGVATGEDLFRVRYQLALYYIDASHYRRAIGLCDGSIQDAQHKGNLKWVMGFITNRGIARYTTLNDPAAARADLEAAIAISSHLPHNEDTDRFLADAFHYLGRCDLDDGNTQGALRYYMMGRKCKERIPFESRAIAYYHIRMAEALTGAGNIDHGRAHLDAAEDYLDRTGDTGSASVSYGYALANLEMASGRPASALATLDEYARRAAACKFSRGRLLALARIFTINLQVRRYLPAILTLFRALPLLLNGELRRNSVLAITARFRRYALHVFRPYEGVSRHATTHVLCPCPIHEAGPMST